MADYGRYENGHGGGFVIGLLTGTVIGAGIGLLLAPKRGSDLRDQVAEQARHFGTRASEQYRKASEAASGWAERGRDIVNQAREAVNRRVEETRGYGTSQSGYHPGPASFGDRPASGTDYGRS